MQTPSVPSHSVTCTACYCLVPHHTFSGITLASLEVYEALHEVQALRVTLRNALKLRPQPIWNAKLARRFTKPYLTKASDQSDGTAASAADASSAKFLTLVHLSLSCIHRLMKGSYNRDAMRLLQSCERHYGRI